MNIDDLEIGDKVRVKERSHFPHLSNKIGTVKKIWVDHSGEIVRLKIDIKKDMKIQGIGPSAVEKVPEVVLKILEMRKENNE